MTIEYLEDKIIKKEKWNNGPLIGYINPNGKIIDFSVLIGEYGHDNWRNPVTPIFLQYISYIIRDKKVEDLKKFTNYDWYELNKYVGIEDVVKRGYDSYDLNNDSYDSFLERLHEDFTKKDSYIKKLVNKYNCPLDKIPKNDILQRDILKLYIKLYSKKDFFDSLGRKIYVDNNNSVCEKYKGLFIAENFSKSSQEQEFYYNNYLIVELMQYFKDILVLYLGYDSIERAWPIGDLNIVNNVHWRSNGYAFMPNPRIITTSAQNINERFYNWLLMDWEIQKVPRKVWNEDKKKFEDEPYVFEYVYKAKEEILGKEIDSIKRLVPREERYKYFR